jgi:diguanylate cyclase (GGDEF)-like protein
MGRATEHARVLVVDDEPQIIEEYLRAFSGSSATELEDLKSELFGGTSRVETEVDFHVESALQGEQAVEMLERSLSAGNRYSSVFLDVQMPPGIDGIETAKRLRALDADMNIVLVTGNKIAEPEILAGEIPPADRLFLFNKPFHATECRQLARALNGKWHADQQLKLSNAKLDATLQRRDARLNELAYYDGVTGLPNRQKLFNELEAQISYAGLGGMKVGVVLLDVCRFRFINETLGYDTGTQLLRRIGHAVARVLRQLDVVGRFGDDKFAFVITEVDDLKTLVGVVDRIRDALAQPFAIGEIELDIEACIGVSMYPDHGERAEVLFRCAEAALQQSKQDSEREPVFYEPEMGERSRRKLSLENELRQAIRNNDIRPFFQPQVVLPDRRPIGAEALARWFKPDGTVVPPDEFIPIVEECGLANQLFESMLEQTLLEARRLFESEAWSGAYSLNLSPAQIREESLPSIVANAVSRMPQPGMLKLELTETVLLEDLQAARLRLEQLVSAGVGIAIDDFGTGYSSLSYLVELPVECLKIDRSFVAHLESSPDRQRLIKAIIALGQSLGLTVVAEGIETEEHLQLLESYGCDALQGFYLSKPLSAEDFCEWLASNRMETAGAG